jgi:hypothetical protein|tara:strand:+ start:88 stop:564 length:477 start_codon:yes stop_codon:yes gene_type:complete
MKIAPRDRVLKIINNLKIEKLPFKVNSENLGKLGLDIAKDIKEIFQLLDTSQSLKWAFSTVKKAKIFVIIYTANENGNLIYKEEISKLLPEYSYKTIATIIDEGISKGYYVELDPKVDDVKDKKIKNIRPSIELITSFYNWSLARISNVSNLIKKYEE